MQRSLVPRTPLPFSSKVIMRRFIIALCLLLASICAAQAAPKFPQLTGRVVDEAHILDADAVAQLTQQLEAQEQQAGNQVVVVTVPDLDGNDIADYGYQLGRAWGIGQNDKDNGVLLIVAPSERAVRIEVGYGLEDSLTDAISRLIIERAILPHFKAGDYKGGIESGVQAILAVLSGGELPAALQQQTQGDSLPLSFIIPILILFLVLRLFARRGGGSGILPFLLGAFLGGRGRGGGDGDSGGFSGGGGSFGGGGASGRW